jgi:hypothetical protein
MPLKISLSVASWKSEFEFVFSVFELNSETEMLRSKPCHWAQVGPSAPALLAASLRSKKMYRPGDFLGERK